jgi:hypothetical protein
MAKRRRKRRARFGAPEADHHKRATAFALEALREVGKAKAAPSCRAALERLGKAERAYGGAVAEASAMVSMPAHVREAVRKIRVEIEEVHGMIASRCLR